MEPLIVTFNLGKKYLLMPGGRPYHPTLAEIMTDVFHPGRTKSQTKEFWAVKNASFQVNRGDCVALIGRNGAGKSTLLKILSRIIFPTLGQAYLRGRIASVLEVGTGFHPELTGRENIYMSGVIQGMKILEIHRRFDEIVAFAEIKEFIDMPAKFYSSGMYVRLAFSICAHLTADILLLDEVLAVGDYNFQEKSFEKIKSLARQEKAVVLVSHDMDLLPELCTRVIWMENGECIEDSLDIIGTIERYKAQKPSA
jgi:lipopolysaccharide transport system ATP-binding protein